jgi:hypothetical protein
VQFKTIISVAFLSVAALAQLTGPNDARTCAGGAISCEYQKKRCANICVGTSAAGGSNAPAFIDPVCSGPAGRLTICTLVLLVLMSFVLLDARDARWAS